MAFKPGQSGNPGGRPKEEAEVIRLAKDKSLRAVERLIHWMESDDPKASIPAANAILDRAIGKPKQAHEHAGPDGEKLVIQIVRYADAPAS
jgi:hypothetical protein